MIGGIEMNSEINAFINKYVLINHKVIFDYLFKSSYMPV